MTRNETGFAKKNDTKKKKGLKSNLINHTKVKKNLVNFGDNSEKDDMFDDYCLFIKKKADFEMTFGTWFAVFFIWHIFIYWIDVKRAKKHVFLLFKYHGKVLESLCLKYH